jgi:hypothetical protein
MAIGALTYGWGISIRSLSRPSLAGWRPNANGASSGPRIEAAYCNVFFEERSSHAYESGEAIIRTSNFERYRRMGRRVTRNSENNSQIIRERYRRMGRRVK